MQGNTIKLKGLFFALFLLMAFSSSGIASNQVGAAQTKQPTIQQSAARININQASAEQLSSLPGIGPAKAEAIIAARDQKGGFTNTTDLLAVKGIGEKTVARLEPLISF